MFSGQNIMLQSSTSAPSFVSPSQELSFQAYHSRPAPPLESESLLKGHKVVEIVHNGNLYKLQATKLGKLILTK